MPRTIHQRADKRAADFVDNLKRENRQGARNGKRVDDKQYDKLQRLLRREIVELSRYSSAGRV